MNITKKQFKAQKLLNNQGLTVLGFNEGERPFRVSVLNLRNYDSYTVLVTQSGTNPPTVKFLEENTIGNITITYDSVGYFYFTSNGLFTADKTATIISSGGAASALQKNVVAVWEDTSNISIQTGTIAAPVVPANGCLTNTFFEIRVYK